MKGQALSASQVLAAQLPKIRQRLGDLSGAALSERIEQRGGKLGRMAISKIENGQRGVSLDEALMLAAALDVAPVHLFAPLDDDEGVAITPELVVDAVNARAWVRGAEPLPGGDEKTYRTEVPASEWRQSRQPTARELEAMDRWQRARRQLRVAQTLLDMRRDDLQSTPRPEYVMGRFDPQVADRERAERRYDEAEVGVAEALVAEEEAREGYKRVARANLSDDQEG
jgi:transcriptional regulator with XRE-family HTH domain